MCFSDAVRCVIERKDMDFRYESGSYRRSCTSKITEEELQKLEEYEDSGQMDYSEKL